MRRRTPFRSGVGLALMPDEPTDKQKTRPKKGDPVEIPVPKKRQIESDFLKVASAEKKLQKPAK